MPKGQHKGKRGGRQPGAGRPKGSLNQKTIDIAIAEQQLRESIAKNLIPITVSAINSTLGERFIYKISKKPKSKGQPVLVTGSEEIAKALYAINEDAGLIDETYYYVQTKPSNSHALGILFDRAFGKAKEQKAAPSDNEIMLGELLRRALAKSNLQNDRPYLSSTSSPSQVNFAP